MIFSFLAGGILATSLFIDNCKKSDRDNISLQNAIKENEKTFIKSDGKCYLTSNPNVLVLTKVIDKQQYAVDKNYNILFNMTEERNKKNRCEAKKMGYKYYYFNDLKTPILCRRVSDNKPVKLKIKNNTYFEIVQELYYDEDFKRYRLKDTDDITELTQEEYNSIKKRK